jgi:hypothetical protein
MMPNWAWPGLETVTSATVEVRRAVKRVRQRPAQRTERRIDSAGRLMRRRIGEALVEHHRDVRPEARLNVSGPLWRQQVARAVEMRLKVGTLFVIAQRAARLNT